MAEGGASNPHKLSPDGQYARGLKDLSDLLIKLPVVNPAQNGGAQAQLRVLGLLMRETGQVPCACPVNFLQLQC